jgi:hypothetical protein
LERIADKAKSLVFFIYNYRYTGGKRMSMEREFKGVWVPKEIYLHEGLTPTDKFLLVEIDSLSKNGECFASNEHFSKFLGITKKHVSKLISKFVNMGLITVDLKYKENTKEVEKRIITPIRIEAPTPPHRSTYPHRIEAPTPIRIEEEDINTVINNTINNTNNKVLNNKLMESEFEDLWKMYPRKQGKKKALQNYIKARKNKVEYETIENGLKNYIKYVKSNNVEEQFIKHGSTWFGNECWNEEYNLQAPKLIQGKRHGFLGLYLNELDKEKNIIDQEPIGGNHFEQRGNSQIISNYPNVFSQPLQEF